MLTVRRRGARPVLMFTLLSSALALIGAAAPVSASASAPTPSYVDCSRSGTGDGSSERPWTSLAEVNEHTFGPGDQLLLRRGVTCKGRLQPKGDGAPGQPVVLASYGAGTARAVVAGGGRTEAAVELIDQSWWTVKDLEVTNASPTRDLRTGVRVLLEDPKPKAGIVLEGLKIHDTAGWGDKTGTNAIKFSYSAGISILSPKDGKVGKGGPIHGLTIRDNAISDTGGGGIKISNRPGTSYHTGVRITGNRISRAGGDGIVVHGSDAPLVDHNVATDLGTGAYPFVAGNFAGMWPINSRNPVFEYNVVTRSTPSTFDSTAWDCDGAIVGTCTYQYNYSQGNAGGFYLDCNDCTEFGNSDARQVLRYNVSQDDCRLALLDDSQLELTHNTFWCTSQPLQIETPKNPRPGRGRIADNVFVAAQGTVPDSSYLTYDNNLYFGGLKPAATDANALTTDPRFTAPGTADDSIGSAKSAYRPDDGSPVVGDATDGTNIGADQRPATSARTYPNLAAAYNSIGISDDANSDVGGFSLTGRSYSGQALQAAGLKPGGSVSTQALSFPWTAAAWGHPDNVKAAGQTIRVSGKGSRLVVLASATSGAYRGTATVTYQDGTSQQVELAVDDWWSPSSGAASTPVVTAAYQNQPRTKYNAPETGRYAHAATVYSTAVAIQSRAVRSVTLPSGSALADAGLHVFSMTVV